MPTGLGLSANLNYSRIDGGWSVPGVAGKLFQFKGFVIQQNHRIQQDPNPNLTQA